jgi:hypothetical protein
MLAWLIQLWDVRRTLDEDYYSNIDSHGKAPSDAVWILMDAASV